MKIEYELFASFAEPKSGDSGGMARFLEMAEGATVEALMRELHLPEDRPKIIFLNGRRVDETALVKDGDRVGIFPLVAGG